MRSKKKSSNINLLKSHLENLVEAEVIQEEPKAKVEPVEAAKGVKMVDSRVIKKRGPKKDALINTEKLLT